MNLTVITFLALAAFTFSLPTSSPLSKRLKSDYFDPPTALSEVITTSSGTLNVYRLTWNVALATKTSNFAGHITKSFIHVNNQYPPPMIKVAKNSRIEITVLNTNVDDGISLHAHGLLQKDAPWMDGPVGVTQKKILKGQKFTYVWNTGEQTGTYWIHSHVSGQYPKGLRSPLVILDGAVADEETSYAGDKMIALSDWYNRDNGKVDSIYEDATCGTGVPVGPDDAVVNDNKAVKTKVTIPNGNTKKTRLRFVNMSAYSSFFVYIRNRVTLQPLTMNVIEADGVKTEEQTFHVIQVHPGQRYSVLISPGSQTQGYAIMTVLDPHEYRKVQISNFGKTDCKPVPISGISWDSAEGLKKDILFDWVPLDFELSGGSTTATPSWVPTNSILPGWVWIGDSSTQWDDYRLCFPWVPNRICQYSTDPGFSYDLFSQTLLRPVPSIAAPPRPNPNTGVFQITFTDVNGLGAIQVGNAPKQLYSGDSSGRTSMDLVANNVYTQDWGNFQSNTWPASSNTFDVGSTANSWVWIVIKSTIGQHPVHLHGHEFQILYASGEKATAQTFDYNAVPVPPANPVRRDTVFLHRNELMVLAVKLDNPGVWFFHCHNDFHAMTGMAAQMVERRNEVRSKVAALTGADKLAYDTLQGGTFPSI
ncbi:Laccase-4 [Dactylellina cionopaga]|nr:Laccase-4 [Dactylellina cionopaga]